jgi:hypothetical protein
LRHSRLDQLQLVVDVAAPVEVEIDLGDPRAVFDLIRAIPECRSSLLRSDA